MFPKIAVPQNGWFIMEPSIKMDDSGENPLFSETSIFLLFPWAIIHIFVQLPDVLVFGWMDVWNERFVSVMMPSFGRVEMMMSFGGFNMRIIRYFEIYVRDQIVFEYSISDVTVCCIYIWNLIAFATFLLLFFHIVFHFTIICHSLFCEHIICILLQDLTLRQIDLCYVITVRTDIILYFIV